MNNHHFPGYSRLLANLIVFFVLSAVCIPLSAAVITVDVSRNPVHINETVDITFTADSAPDGDPDFSPLETDFEILNQSSNSQVSIINGNVTRNYQWTVTVIPKQAGGLIIPSVSFGSDRSPATVLQVKAEARQSNANSKASGDVFLEVNVAPADPYVQAQVIYTVRVFHRAGIAQAELSEPEVDNAVVEQIGKDTKYRTQRGNHTYDVYERRYAIFPQSSGKLEIAPIRLNAEVITGQRSRGFFFNRDVTRTERMVSESLELNVKPIPHAFTGKHWLPASSLELTQSWSDDPSQAVVGEPVTQTLTLQAEGLMKSQLPTLSDIQKDKLLSQEIKLYPDQPVLTQAGTANGLMSRREEKIAMIPGKSGAIKLPAIEIPWWNTKTDRMEIARIEETVMRVKAARGAPSPPANIQSTGEVREGQKTPAKFNISNKTQTRDDLWKWVSLALGLGWLLTTVAFVYFALSQKKHRSITQHSDGSQQTANRYNRSDRLLRHACQNNQPAEAKTELLSWARARWPEDPPTNLAEIGKRIPALRDAIEELEQVLYKPAMSAWDGIAFWEQFKTHRGDHVDQNDREETRLEPLFKA